MVRETVMIKTGYINAFLILIDHTTKFSLPFKPVEYLLESVFAKI